MDFKQELLAIKNAKKITFLLEGLLITISKKTAKHLLFNTNGYVIGRMNQDTIHIEKVR